jgi:titin
VRKRLEGRRRRRIGAVVAVTVVALFGTGVAPASAVPVVDVVVAKEGELGTQAYWLLQTVTATRSGLLTDVGFPSTVNGNGGADGYTVNVRRVQPGQPTPLAGAVIASGVASGRAVSFAEPVSWVAGSVYSFQLVSPRDDAMRWYAGGTYDGGSLTTAYGDFGTDLALSVAVEQDRNAAPAFDGTLPTELTLPFGAGVDRAVVHASGTPTPELTATGLPAGLTLLPDGRITGTPTAVGRSDAVVTADNGVGATASTTVTITVEVVAPGLVRNLTSVPGDSGAAVSWSAPASDGGAPTTSHDVEWSVDGTHYTPVAPADITAGLARVTGLDNGTTTTIRVRAVSSAGPGGWATTTVTPRTTPGLPADLDVVARVGSAQVMWAAPTDDGGSAVQGYEVAVVDAGGERQLDPGDVDPAGTTVTGLAPGTTAHIRVRAVNAAGPGAWASAPVVALSALSEPRALVAAPLDGAVRLTWQPPQSDGGETVTGYQVVRAIDGVPVQELATSSDLEQTVTGLTNGSLYELWVRAVTASGTGPWARSAATPVGTPSVPRDLSAVPGDGSVALSWAPPADDGGSAVLGYAVTVDDGTTARVLDPAETTGTGVTVAGLRNGTTYTVSVVARTGAGVGQPAVTTARPRTAPGAPLELSAVARDGSADLSWTPPADDGGDPVSGYEVAFLADDGRTWSSAPGTTGTSTTLGGLQDGTTYGWRVRAVNAAGPGPWRHSSVTPFRVDPQVTDGAGRPLAGRTVARGEEVVVEASGLPAGGVLVVELHSAVLEIGRATVAADGTARVRARIPASATPGAHHVVVRVAGDGLDAAPARIPVQIAAVVSEPAAVPAAGAPAAAPSPVLADTGAARLSSVAGLAGAVIAAGAALVALRQAGRRRRAAPAAPSSTRRR